MRASVLVVLLVSTALAGCSGGGKGGRDEAPEADFDELGLEATSTTGVIRGIAVDEAIRPLGGVSIGTALADGSVRNTTSAADGAFGFDGLPPGSYILRAGKTGYLSVQANAEVVAGVDEPPIVKVLLVADPASLPYVSSFVYDAFVACSFTFPVVSFAACGVAEEATNNEFLVDYEADKVPDWVQTEAVWETTQELGNELGLSITDFHSGPQVTVNATDGPSPIYITVNRTTAERFEYGVNNTITIRLFSTELTGTDAVPEEQVHAVWASSLYGPVNGTGAPGLYQSTVTDNDPCLFVGCVLTNPIDDPDCIKYAVLFDSCQRFGGVGMALEQKVSVFTQIFYGYQPPPDWRFSVDSDVPQPPQPPA